MRVSILLLEGERALEFWFQRNGWNRFLFCPDAITRCWEKEI